MPTRHPDWANATPLGFSEQGQSRRSIDSRSHNTDNKRVEIGRVRNDRPGRKQKTRVTAEDAIYDLYAKVKEAYGFYKRLENEFCLDTQRITYVNVRTLDDIWIQKLNLGETQSRNFRQSHGDQGGSLDRRDRGLRIDYRSMARRLLDCFDCTFQVVALTGHREKDHSRSASRYTPEEVSRICHHLGKERPSISKLLYTAPKRISEMKTLVTELDMLLIFLRKHIGEDQPFEDSAQDERYLGINSAPVEYNRSDESFKDDEERPSTFSGQEGIQPY